MKTLFRAAVAAVVFAGLAGAAPAAAQSGFVDVRIGAPGYHYRPHYRHGHRARWRHHRHLTRHHRHPAYYRMPGRYYYRDVRPHARHYLRWY